ncbi:hypothetical protein Vafri_16696 [Volvox africanus]|nr:hypothetical protein Vafri_16696 [Volvox africanus]
MMTPRTLTPRTLTPSNLRIASYSNPPAAIFSIPSGSPAPAIAVPITSPSSVRETGQTFAVGSCSPQMLQPMQSTTVLSPCGSERLEQLCSSPTQTPMQAPPVRQATGTSAGPNAYNSAMTTITNNSSNCNNLDWQAHTHAPAAEGPGRSRGQHLIVHLEHYVLQLPAPIAATAAGGGCSSRDMNCRSLGRDSSLAAVPTVHSGYSAASPTLAFHGPLVPGASLCAVPGASGASVGLSPGGGGGAGTTTRPTGSLWSAVAAMERLDLRGVPLPSWWARNPALRPASVLIDESMVYEEPPPAPAPVTSPGFASGGPSGGGGTSGGGGLELPHHVVRSLEAGLAQGLVVIDLNSPEYKSISRCQQLVAIYTALQCATHITISNTTRIGGAASGIPPVSGLHSVTSQQLQQQPLSGGGGMTLVRSATSSFPRTNSGTAAFSMYAGQVSGGGGCRLQSDTGYAAGCGGGSGGAMPLRPTSTLRSSSLAAVRGTVSAVNGGVGGSGNNGSMHMCRASSLRGSGGTLATALVTSPPLGSLGSGDLGGGAGSASVAGRVSITRRGGEGTVSSLHRFALERGGSSFTAPTASGGGGSKGNATDGGAAVAVASAAGMCEPSVLPSATLGRVSVNLYQNATAFPTVRTHTGQTIQYHNSHRLNSFRKQLNLRNGIHIPTASVNANQLLQSVLPYYPSPQAAALPGIDAARSVQPAAVLSGPWGSGPNTPGGTGGTCLAGAFGSGIEGDGAASAPLVISQTNMLWSGQVVDHSSAHSTGSQLEHSKLQQHQRHQEYQELQQQQQGAPYVVRSRTIGTCLAVVVEAAGGGSGGGAPCSAPCGLGGGGGLGGGDSSSRDPLAATTAATPTAAELFYPKGAANDLAEAIDVQSRQSLDQTAAQGSASIGSTATRAAVEEAVCLQAVGLHRLLEDRTTDKGTEGSGAAIAKELLSAGTSQGLPLHSCVDLTSPNSSVFGLPVTTTTAENPAASGGSGGFGSGRLKPPPMAMSMPVPVPAPAQSPRVPSVSFGTMVVRGMRRAVGAGAVGDNEVNNAANADVQSPAGSTGSRQSSFLLVGGMAPEILDAGLAILRGASDNMAPPPIPADPTGTAAAPTKPALEQQSAGPVPGSNQASQTTEVEMRSLSSNTSSVKQTAAPMLPHPNPMSIVVPSVHQDAPAGSFSFTQYSRKSLEGGIQDSTLDVVSKCLPAPLSPLGASRPLPLTMEPTSGSGSLLAPATAASSTVLQRPSLEVASTAAAPLAALWGGSNGADDGAGGVNRRGIGSSVDLHNGEEEDLEVSFRVEAIAMAAQRSLKNGSVQGSAGAVVDDERLLSTLAASLPVDAVGEMMSPLAEHSDGDGHGVGVLAVRPGPLELVQFRSDLCNALSMHPPWVSTPSSHRGAEPRTMLSAALLAAANAAEAAVSDDIGRGGGETAAAASLGALTAGNGEGTDSNDADDGDSQLQAVSEAHEFADGLSAARASPPVGPAAAWILNPNSPPYQSQPQRHSYDYGQTASSVAGGPHDGSLNPPNLVLKSIGAVATASHQIAGDATVGSVGGISVSRVFSRIRSASAVEPASSASPVKDVNTEPDMITTTTETGTDVGDDRGSNAATAGAGAGAAATTISPSANQQHTSPVFNAAAAAAAISGGVVSTGGTSCGALRAQFGLGACGSGYIGVEASNAVAVVITVGYDGQLRVPLRCLELPLRAAMARRSGTTVSFRVTGLSHEGMRQLRALMAVAKVPVPERTYAWLLPSQSMHQYTGNGYTPAPGGCGPVSCTSQPLPGAGNSQILHSASAAFPSGSGLYSGLGLMYHGGGPGSPTGLMASRAISRMDSGAVYGGMPSYYFDNRGLPIDLGYILPPPTDSAEPSECLSASTHPATTVVMTGLQSLARTCSTPASAAAAVLPADGCELSPPPQAPRAPLSSWTVSVAGLVAGASPLPLPPPGSAPSSYELDPLLQQRVSPSWRSPHTSTAAEGNGTADGTGRLNGVNGGGEAVAEPNYRDGMSMSPFRASPPPMAMPTSSRSSTEDVLMQPPVAPTGEARVDGEAVDANRLNNNQSHHFKHHHGIPVQRRNPGGGSGPHNLPHGIMFVNLALQRPATPPTPLLAGSPGGASPTAGHNAIRSNNNKNSGLNAICNEGDREQYDDAAAATTSIGGAADDGVQHPLNMGTLGYRSSDLRVPSIAGVRCGGAFSGCGGLASASSSAFGCQSLGSCIADLARDSNTPLAPSLATPALIASAAGPWEHLDNRGLNDLTLGPFGSSIGVRSSS